MAQERAEAIRERIEQLREQLADAEELKLIACGDPIRHLVVSAIVTRLIESPRWVVVWAEDETRLHLLCAFVLAGSCGGTARV